VRQATDPPQRVSPRRALVIKLGHIGDVLVTTPVITALKETWPELSITALVNQGTEAMLQNSPYVDEVIALERDHEGRLSELAYQLGLLKRLRSARFDLSLELSGGDRGAFLSLASGAKTRVGFAPKKPHVRARAFHVLADATGTQNHVVETFLRQVRALGIEPNDTALKLYPDAASQAKAATLLRQHGLESKQFALLHPTSRWMFKCWTPEGNAALIRRLGELGLPVVLTAAPAQKELDFLEQALEQDLSTAEVINLAGQVDLPLLGALIEQARVFIGVDSAPMHMAAALGTPTLVLFGPSGEKMWGPWQSPAQVLTGDCEDRPCGRDGCDGSKISRCLVELPPEKVIAALDKLLGEA
jgi:heptosyltransferase-3